MRSTRSLRLVVYFLLAMVVGACSDPVGPPEQDEPDNNDPTDPDSQGFVVYPNDTFWV